MRTMDAVRRSGVGIGPERSVRDAKVIMEQAGVGSLAVIDGARMIGMVTDRDLVRRALTVGFTPDARVDTVMSSTVITIAADADLHEALALFRPTVCVAWRSCETAPLSA